MIKETRTKSFMSQKNHKGQEHHTNDYTRHLLTRMFAEIVKCGCNLHDCKVLGAICRYYLLSSGKHALASTAT